MGVTSPNFAPSDGTPVDTTAIADRVRALMPQVLTDLEDLTRIPSISLSAYDQAHVEASAEATAALLRAEGLEVEIVREGAARRSRTPARTARCADRHALRPPRRPAHR